MGFKTLDVNGNLKTAASAGAITESSLTLSDVTTNDVTSTKHGFAPKSPADATKFLNGAATPAYALVKDSDLSTSDITTNNVTTAKHGFTPKLSNDATTFLSGAGTYITPSSSGTGWTTVVVKPSDQSIDNNTTLTNDTALKIAMTSGDFWYFQLLFVYDGNGVNSDVKGNFTFPTSAATGRSHGYGQADAVTSLDHVSVGGTGTAFSVNFIAGGGASSTEIRMMFIEAWVTAAGTGDFHFKFALQSGAVGRIVTSRAKSTLRGLKLA